MKAKLSGSEQNIRSTVIIDAVIGEVDVGSMSKMLQEKCGATHVKIDASSEQSTGRLAKLTYADLHGVFSWILRNR